MVKYVIRWMTICLGVGAIGLLAWPAQAQAPAAEPPLVDEPAPLEAESAAVVPADSSIDDSIFQHLKIDLGDLEALAERASEILAGETVRISLDDAVQAALLANQNLLVVSYEPKIAEANIGSARGQFDPLVYASARETDSDQPATPQAFVFGGITSSIKERTDDFRLGFGGLTPYGTQYDLSYGSTRTIGTFTGDESDFAVGLTLTVSQPLLRGFGKSAQLARVRIARNTLTMTDHQVLRLTEVTLGDVIKAYWNLVGSIENLRVQRESLANANRLVAINEQRLEIGTAAAIEVLQSKAGAASRVSDLITARTLVDNAEDALKQLMGMQDGDLFSSNHIEPIQRPQMRPVDWNLERSMQTALENRPEIWNAELQIDSSEIDRKYARNQRLPQLDLEGTYTRNDRSFDWGDANEGARLGDGETWSLGLVGSIPLGNRTAKNNLRAAELRLQQNEQRLLQQQQNVMLDVRIALRQAISNEVLVESTRQTRILEEANVAAEEKRLRLGVTTSQDLLDRQEDLTTAQVAEVRSMVNFEKALVDLRVAEGMLLPELGVTMEAAEAP